ncbi:hypothetical protein CYMTET_33790 [Cymbomonas tetramitiformis]|uniref:Uncharacterized protein n=1 Tax=Cymbomonas tetramitiformis TaxID=36881 RepID=A0AAE0FCE6_9CHLO|nr:hypothetical protein CYMTET_33790 [Cymbomonas tetramitiformis]
MVCGQLAEERADQRIKKLEEEQERRMKQKEEFIQMLCRRAPGLETIAAEADLKTMAAAAVSSKLPKAPVTRNILRRSINANSNRGPAISSLKSQFNEISSALGKVSKVSSSFDTNDENVLRMSEPSFSFNKTTRVSNRNHLLGADERTSMES